MLFVFARGYASALRHLLHFLAWLCARCSCISDHHEFHCGVRLHRNAEQTRQHIQVDAWIRTCQLHVVFCISQAVCYVLLCVVSFVCGLLIVLFCCVFRVCNRTLFGLGCRLAFTRGSCACHCFSFRILLHTSLLQDVLAYPVTTSFIVVFGYKGTQSRQGNTDGLIL